MPAGNKKLIGDVVWGYVCIPDPIEEALKNAKPYPFHEGNVYEGEIININYLEDNNAKT